MFQVSDADKEAYQTQVNEAMSRYKQEYNDWFESLSIDEQKVGILQTVVRGTLAWQYKVHPVQIKRYNLLPPMFSAHLRVMPTTRRTWDCWGWSLMLLLTMEDTT